MQYEFNTFFDIHEVTTFCFIYASTISFKVDKSLFYCYCCWRGSHCSKRIFFRLKLKYYLVSNLFENVWIKVTIGAITHKLMMIISWNWESWMLSTLCPVSIRIKTFQLVLNTYTIHFFSMKTVLGTHLDPIHHHFGKSWWKHVNVR